MDTSTSFDIAPTLGRRTAGEQLVLPALTAAAAIPATALGRVLLGTAITAGAMAANCGPWRGTGQARLDAGKPAGWESPRQEGELPDSSGLFDEHARPTGEGVHVRLLGPVEVVGPSQRARLAGRARELVVLLAVTGGHRATRDRIRGRLGADADTPMGEAYFRQTCTRARTLLGTGTDGQPLLLYEHGGYRLHRDLVIDWELFQALLTRAKDRGPAGVADLRRALSLVRGEPLEDCGYRWIDPVLIEHMRACIVEAADLLARIGGADPAMVAWAACRGLLADPYAEQLYRALMTASHALGHSRGVHLAYQLCEDALALLDLRPHRQTTALHRDLTNSPHLSTPRPRSKQSMPRRRPCDQ